MNYQLFRSLVVFAVGVCCLVAAGALLRQVQAGPAQRGATVETGNAPFDPMKELAITFPDTIKIKNSAHLLEFCLDGTCDGFVVSGSMPVATLRDFAYLYEYFFSDYIYLGEWRARKEARNAAERVLSKPEYRGCKHITDQKTARCVLVNLSSNGRVRLIFVRYDEGERHVVHMDLAKQLAEKEPASK
jgi:hypothetical protein